MIPQAALRLAFLRGIRAGLKGEGPALVGESWAEDDPALPRLEARAIGWVVGRWRRLRDDCLAALGLAGAKAASKAVTSGAFRFTTEDLIDLIIRSNGFAAEAAGPDGPLIRAFVAAWARGWTNAGRQINATDEVAAAVAFLASPAASGITGTTLTVDAGLMAGNLPFLEAIT